MVTAYITRTDDKKNPVPCEHLARLEVSSADGPPTVYVLSGTMFTADEIVRGAEKYLRVYSNKGWRGPGPHVEHRILFTFTSADEAVASISKKKDIGKVVSVVLNKVVHVMPDGRPVNIDGCDSIALAHIEKNSEGNTVLHRLYGFANGETKDDKLKFSFKQIGLPFRY